MRWKWVETVAKFCFLKSALYHVPLDRKFYKKQYLEYIEMHLYCKKSYLLDLLAVKNLPILGSLYQVLVFGDTSNGTFSYDHVHMSGP